MENVFTIPAAYDPNLRLLPVGGIAPRPASIIKMVPRTNARMGRVDRNWTKSGGRLSPIARGFVSG